MGLDMYLSAKRYLSQYDDQDAEVIKAVETLPIKGRGDMRPKEICFEAMYWRKANAIHAWFVDNVQEGEDDCGEYYVSIEQLKVLIALCRQFIETRDPMLMPPRSGFFFGSTDDDEYYYEDLKSTVDTLTKILEQEDIDNFGFYYQSSW
jgi:hypothetical protein